jgi:hypothetical protein
LTWVLWRYFAKRWPFSKVLVVLGGDSPSFGSLGGYPKNDW